MKKDFIFAPIILVVGILLFLLKATGMAAHIAVSIVGLAVLVVYAVLTMKEWKFTALEIAMRAFYGLALISGIVIKVNCLPAIAVAHKVSAAIFVILLIALFVIKLVVFKSGNDESATTTNGAE